MIKKNATALLRLNFARSDNAGSVLRLQVAGTGQ